MGMVVELEKVWSVLYVILKFECRSQQKYHLPQKTGKQSFCVYC